MGKRWPRRCRNHTLLRVQRASRTCSTSTFIWSTVTGPQAFDGLRAAGRSVRRPTSRWRPKITAMPTVDIDKPIADPISRTQVETLRRNCEGFGVPLYSLGTSSRASFTSWVLQLGLTNRA